MNLRDLIKPQPEGSLDERKRTLFERFGILDNPFPAASQTRDHPRLVGPADREIAARVSVFDRPPRPSQAIVILGTQGVGKTNLLSWYESQFEDYYRGQGGYYIIKYYPDPEQSFDQILHRIFEDLQQNNLLEQMGNKLVALGETGAQEVFGATGHADFCAVLQRLRRSAETKDPPLATVAGLAVEWMIGLRILNRHREALGIRLRLDTLEAKTRVLRDLVETGSKLGLLQGIFLLLDELEKLDQSVSKVGVVRFLLAVRALIDALPRHLFLLLAMTPGAYSRYLSFLPALAGRLQYRVHLRPLENSGQALELAGFYLEQAQEKARPIGAAEHWKAGRHAVVSQEEMQQIFTRLSTEAVRQASSGVTQRAFLHALHAKAEERMGAALAE